MNDESGKFLKLIEKGLVYQNTAEDESYVEDDYYVNLYEDTLLKQGFEPEDIWRLISKFKNEGLITVVLVWKGRSQAPTTFGSDTDKNQVGATNDHPNFPRVYHNLHIDKKKLDKYLHEEKSDEQKPEKKIRKSNADKDLFLIWDGFDSITDPVTNKSIRCREGFVKTILTKSFHDFNNPQREIERAALNISQKTIKQSLKNLRTNWSKKFTVSNEKIRELINYDSHKQAVIISSNITSGKNQDQT